MHFRAEILSLILGRLLWSVFDAVDGDLRRWRRHPSARRPSSFCCSSSHSASSTASSAGTSPGGRLRRSPLRHFVDDYHLRAYLFGIHPPPAKLRLRRAAAAPRPPRGLRRRSACRSRFAVAAAFLCSATQRWSSRAAPPHRRPPPLLHRLRCLRRGFFKADFL
jgi:hypothetical protein